LKDAEPLIRYFDELVTSVLARNGNLRSKDKADLRRGIVEELTGKA
jgi:hypothetical protein